MKQTVIKIAKECSACAGVLTDPYQSLQYVTIVSYNVMLAGFWQLMAVVSEFAMTLSQSLRNHAPEDS